MTPDSEISSIFNKFAGREVPMTEEVKTIELKSIGITETHTDVFPTNPHDPVLEEMRNEAKKNGLILRIWWPGVNGTADMRNDRVNATIEKGVDGKWRVGSRFDIS
jgi:hypothetical protein